jgi:biotin transport system substrate-specific component
MQTTISTGALAPSLLSTSGSRALQQVLLVLVGTAVLAISAKISVPFYPVPMTLQTFAVMALAAAYGSRLAVATVFAYLIEGAAGLPVFSTGAGFAYLAGPTGGFLVGFVALAGLVGEAADRGWDRSFIGLFAAMIVADALVFAFGFVWLAWFAHLPAGLMAKLALSAGSTGAGAAFAWAHGVVPFVLGDLLKIALAAAAVPAARGLTDKFKAPG